MPELLYDKGLETRQLCAYVGTRDSEIHRALPRSEVTKVTNGPAHSAMCSDSGEWRDRLNAIGSETIPSSHFPGSTHLPFPLFQAHEWPSELQGFRSSLNHLDLRAYLARNRSEPGVAGEQPSAHSLREREVGRIIGADVAAQLPDPAQQRFVPVARDRQVHERLQRGVGACPVEVTDSLQPPKDVRDLDGHQMRRTQGIPRLP